MRYIKIKSDSIKEKGGDSFKLRTDEALTIGAKLSLLRFPLKLEGESYSFGVQFELEPELSQAGVILLGAHLEGDEVSATLMCIGKTTSVKVKKGGSVLIGKLYEKVLFFKERK